MADCNCPTDGTLSSISEQTCPFDLKQIQRIAFAVRGKIIWDSAVGDGTKLAGVPQVDSQLDLKADWLARSSANDSTKIIFTPLIGGDPIIEAGDPITEGGGDNTTLNGVEEVTGVNPSNFSCTFKSLSPTVEKELKKIACATTEVYFFNEDGKIISSQGVGKTQKGFPLQSFFFSDRNNAGYGTKDTFAMRFSLKAGWSETMVMTEPADFNPLYDL